MGTRHLGQILLLVEDTEGQHACMGSALQTHELVTQPVLGSRRGAGRGARVRDAHDQGSPRAPPAGRCERRFRPCRAAASLGRRGAWSGKPEWSAAGDGGDAGACCALRAGSAGRSPHRSAAATLGMKAVQGTAASTQQSCIAALEAFFEGDGLRCFSLYQRHLLRSAAWCAVLMQAQTNPARSPPAQDKTRTRLRMEDVVVTVPPAPQSALRCQNLDCLDPHVTVDPVSNMLESCRGP